jgi:ArsR family transcriptional regulator
VVNSRRDGVNVYYRISNTKIIEACGLMRELLMEQVAEKHRIIEGLKRK